MALSERKYQYNTTRAVLLWAFPTAIILLSTLFIYLEATHSLKLGTWNILVPTLLLLSIAGIFLLLFINHLPIAGTTKIILSGKIFTIIQGDTTISGNVDEVQSVEACYCRRSPWSSIRKWVIQVHEKQITVSSLTISASVFEMYFQQYIIHQQCIFPTISKAVKSQQGSTKCKKQ